MKLRKVLIIALILIVGIYLFSNYIQMKRKREVEFGLKDAHSLILHAITQAKDWNGSFDLMLDASYNQTQMPPTYYFAKNYLEPSLKISKKSYGAECFFNAEILQQIDGSYAKAGLFEACPGSKYPNFLLPNGMTLSVHNSYTQKSQIVLIVDINGKKGANKIGQDIFYYLVDQNSNNLSFGIGLGCNGFNCGKCGEYAGTDCGGMIMRNRWKIPADYPIKKW